MSEIYLAFDFGLRRIGVAVGQAITGSATPLDPLLAQKGEPDWKIVDLLIETWRPRGLIVGMPYRLDGQEQALSFAARKFAQTLIAHYHLPVDMVDERLTTKEAKRRLSQSGLKVKDLPSLDSFAAKLIFETWFSEKG